MKSSSDLDMRYCDVCKSGSRIANDGYEDWSYNIGQLEKFTYVYLAEVAAPPTQYHVAVSGFQIDTHILNRAAISSGPNSRLCSIAGELGALAIGSFVPDMIYQQSVS